MAAYVARLRELAQFCEYGETLEDMLRDRLVCGIQDERWQRQLLAVPELKFKDAFEKVQSYEAAEANAKTLSTKKSEQLTWTPAEQPSSTKGRAAPCYRCGGRHAAQGCRFRDTICNFCKKRGHLARACRGRRKGPTGTNHPPTTHCLNEEPDTSEALTEDAEEYSAPMWQVCTDRVDRVLLW